MTKQKNILVGAHILGNRAGDIINIPQLSMSGKFDFREIKNVLFTQPSFAELSQRIADMVGRDSDKKGLLKNKG